MKNLIILISSLIFSSSVFAQNYWQQEADYNIFVDVNTKKDTYTGNQEIIYTNNSLDTLNKVFFHLYFNAFYPGSDMAERLDSGDDINTRFSVNINNLSQLLYLVRWCKWK